MTQEQWSRVEAYFSDLQKLATQDRPAALASIEDPEVRVEVASLLDYSKDGEDGVTLVSLVGKMADQQTQAASLTRQRIGPYRLVRRVGQGGQGAVYEAVRDDGTFQQRVAIKIVKWDSDSEPARERFRQERQILAGLQHPYIARLLDGGETDEGSPYIVMEFVEGQPLTVAAADWPVRRKLQLFLKVCEALAYAHRNLVIHRDLKPANILVTQESAKAAAGGPKQDRDNRNPAAGSESVLREFYGSEAKVLDFGIAKLIDPASTRTQTGMVALTPDYASPEQVRGEMISTASDVYSLGVVLYELLTNRKPYATDTTSWFEIVKVVCERPPAPPALGDDLDPIILMALRKEPERRYLSVRELASDIERWLENRPVLARPDTIRYRTGKYVRRHWVAVLAVTIAFLGISLGAALAVYQARIAQQRFNDVRQLANSFLFDFDNEIAALPGALKARQMVVATALKYLDSLARGAGGDPALQRELAQAYDRVGAIQGNPGAVALGRLDDALVSYRKSLAIYGQITRKSPDWRPEMSLVRMHYAWALRAAGEVQRAIAEDREVVATLEDSLRSKPGDNYSMRALGKAHGDLTSIYLEDLNEGAARESMSRSMAATQATIPGADPTRVAVVMSSRYLILLEVNAAEGDVAGALAAAEQLEVYRRRWMEKAPNNINAINTGLDEEGRLSQIYDSPFSPSLGDPGIALEHANRAEALLKTLLQDPNNAEAKQERAYQLRRYSHLHRLTAPEAAVGEARESISILEQQEKELGAANYLVAEELAATRLLLASHLSHLGRDREARESIDRALEFYDQVVVKTKGAIYYRRAALRGLVEAAACYRNLNNWQAALDANRKAVEMAQLLEPLRTGEVALLWVVGNAYAEYGRCLLQRSDPKGARTWFEKDAAIWRDWPNANQYVQLRQRLADANLAHRPPES